ncbi:MAG: family 10 glycosylhydrolase [bacterium]|nr:family 10 glycosylhydrolase [bacterium]
MKKNDTQREERAMTSYRCLYRAAIALAVIVLVNMVVSAAWAQKAKVIYVSWGDNILLSKGDAQLDTLDKIDRQMRFWKEDCAADIVLWRVSSRIIKDYYVTRPASSMAYYKKVAEIEAVFDPIKAAVKAAHKYKLRIYAYTTINDWGAPESILHGGNTPFPWQSRFTIEHPQYQVIDRSQKEYQYGVLEYAYPEARQYIVRQISKMVREYKYDGVYLCTRTHSRPAEQADKYGFNKPVVEEYMKRYGVDILKHDFDLEKWRKLRGEYFVQLYRELRRALPNTVLMTGIPRGRYIGPPYGNMYLDWESLVRNRLVDHLVIGISTGKTLYPNLVSIAHADLGYLSSEDDKIGIPIWEDAVNRIYGPLCHRYGVNLSCWGEIKSIADSPLLHSCVTLSPAGTPGIARIAHYDALNCTAGQMTVSFWMKPRRYPFSGFTQRIISKYDHQLSANTGRGYEIYLDSKGRINFRANTCEPVYDITLTGVISIGLDEWNHVACVIDGAGGYIRIYVNGCMDAERPVKISRLNINPGVDLFLGRYGGYEDWTNYEGLLDDLVISKRAMLLSGVPLKPFVPDDDTVACFNFDAIDKGIADKAVTRYNDALVAFGGKNTLSDSMPGFGKSLKIGSQ